MSEPSASSPPTTSGEAAGGHAASIDGERPRARSRQLVAQAAGLECPAFATRQAKRAGAQREALPIVLASGQGSIVTDVDGNRYVDLAAGFGALLVGHGAPTVMRAIRQQGEQLVQGLGDLYASETKVRLLSALVGLHPDPNARVLLTQSGGDAVTAALKTASLATGRHALVAFDGAYHGLGYGPLAACGYNPDFSAPFAPQLNPAIHHAPYPGVRGATAHAAIDFVAQALSHHDVAAVLIEPVLGRGGMVVPPNSFLRELGALAHSHGALLIADEIMSGVGRTGAWLRSQAVGAEPDIVCLGKGLGGGLPVSACIASAEVMAGWQRAGEVIHTSTHAGAPLGCAAALATIEAIAQGDLLRRAEQLGRRAKRSFEVALTDCPAVRQVRGIGLMIAVELDSAARVQHAVGALLRRGYLVVPGGVDGASLTLTPALNIEEQLLLGFGEALRRILEP